MKILITIFLSVVFAYFPVHAQDNISIDDKSDIFIFFEITPGKPGAPTELIEVRKLDNDYFLEIRREHKNTSNVERNVVSIPKYNFSSIVQIINTYKLNGFIPEPSNSVLLDYGESHILIKRVNNKDTTIVTDANWSQPLKNGTGVNKLQQALKQIANESNTKIKLYYF